MEHCSIVIDVFKRLKLRATPAYEEVMVCAFVTIYVVTHMHASA